MKKPPLSPVERAIKQKRTVIARWKAEQQKERREAEEHCAWLQKKIDRETVLIDALEKGTLKP